MNNNTVTPPDIAQIDELAVGISQLHTENYACLASLTVLVYSTALSLSNETNYMWRKKLSIPSVLYFLARYGTFSFFCTTLVSNFLPPTASLSTCNIVDNFSNTLSVLAYTGTQGLLVARAYSLSQSLNSRVKGPFLTLLGLLYLAGVVIPIYISAAYPGCIIPPQAADIARRHHQPCVTIATDSAAFAVTIYQVWDTWIVQRELWPHSSNGIVPLLLKQGIWRYSFVLSVTLIDTILLAGTAPGVYSIAFTLLQESLSTVLLCEFSLQLRRNNQPSTEELRVHMSQSEGQTLPLSQVQNARAALRSLHHSITAEFGQLEVDIFDFSDTDDRSDVETNHIENRAAM